MTKNTKMITRLALFTAMSLIVFLIESLFPPLFLPGAKMGLSNIFSLLTLVTMGVWQAYTVVIVRTLLGAMLTGSLSTLMYSFSAGLVAVTVSVVLFKIFGDKLSLVSISVAAAVCHNITQNFVFVAVSQTPQMLGYAPYLAAIGVLAGIIVGIAVTLIRKLVDKRLKEKFA